MNVTDYLLKPYTFERFVQAITRAQDGLTKKESKIGSQLIPISETYRKHFFQLIMQSPKGG